MFDTEQDSQPKTEIKPHKPAVKPLDYNTDFNNVDGLIKEMAAPKQDFTPTASEISSKSEPYDPTSNYTDEQTPIDPETNRRNGKRTAVFFDGLISSGASWWADSTDRSEYSADNGDINDLGEAWAEYTKDKPFNIPPWANLAGLYAFIYLPKMVQANNDKRFNEQEKRIKQLEKQQQEKTQKENEETSN